MLFVVPSGTVGHLAFLSPQQVVGLCPVKLRLIKITAVSESDLNASLPLLLALFETKTIAERATQRKRGGGGKKQPGSGSSQRSPVLVPVLALGRSTHGSPPEHLHRPDRRRGCARLRALHRAQLLLQAAGLVSSGGVQLHQRGETEPSRAEPNRHHSVYSV